jgi:branched-chain amino acid aminotransferase
MADSRIAIVPVALPEPTPDADVARLIEHPGFGAVFTDHMITIRYKEGSGWFDGQLTARRALPFELTAMVFHYGQEIFEGLKAYAQPGGGVAIFRPHTNAGRLNASARRMAMPELPEETFIEALQTLVEADRRFVPKGEGQSLYLRPFMLATESALGIRPAREYLFAVLASPADPIFSADVRPVTVWLSHEYVRAAPGGTGSAKTGGNYAATLLAQRAAAAEGCDQVVWLDAIERRYVEEMGGMNICFVFDDGDGDGARLVTPELTGTLLDGVTRDSLLTLAGDLGIGASEERIDVAQWEKGCREGQITEVFACGTAAVITPVGHVRYSGGAFDVADGEIGPVTVRLRQALLDIQCGRAPDAHGWMMRAL